MSNNKPTIIELRPIKRIWPSPISINFLNASRQVRGDRKGIMPSKININAIAIRKVSHISKQLQKDTKLQTFHYYTALPTVKILYS